MSLFGAAARGELQPESEVDLLVEFKRSSKTGLFDYVHMQAALSPLFGNRPIRLSSPGILDNASKRRAILRDLRTLYEARP
jgi:predicted nucleotidyltransferase